MTVEEAHQYMLELRGVNTPCEDCSGSGVKVYGSTATWRGGIGGQTLTTDVCNKCWGSGDRHRQWPSHRLLRRISELEASNRRWGTIASVELQGRMMHAQTKSIPVKYLRARCGVRYWEDGTVNGEEDTDGSRIPCREGTAANNDYLGGGNWCPLIDLDTGKIEGWPAGTVASIHYKVCDDGVYELLDENRNVVTAIDGYVPSIMCPEGNGYGDYVIMEVAADGKIANWRVDLSEFERNSD